MASGDEVKLPEAQPRNAGFLRHDACGSMVVLRRAAAVRVRKGRGPAESGLRDHCRHRSGGAVRAGAAAGGSNGSELETDTRGEQAQMANTHGGTAPDYFVPAPSQWPMVGMIAMAFTGIGAGSGSQPQHDRLHSAGDRAGDAFLHDVRLVLDGVERVRARRLQPEGRRLVPLGDGLVHLLGGDVLRLVLRCACSMPA